MVNKAFPPTGGPPPYTPYHEVGSSGAVKFQAASMWNPLHWPKWTWLATFIFCAAVAIGVSVGVVEADKKSSYPDYSYINYTISDRLEGTDFFDSFTYYTAADPTDGFVVYVDAETADSSQYNLTYASDDVAILRVDTSDQDATNGRYSVRITSNTQYSDGLFVFDIVHTPYGCATWPALWLTDPDNWPAHGEIDVLEAVNQAATGNSMTLHTTSGCTMNVKRKETGTAGYTNCLNTTNDNAGCGVTGADDTFGAAFNDNGGGVYAMELRDAGIRIWMWDRDSIPDDLTEDNDSSPDPTGWGEALADFPSTDCDISSHFKNLSIIANIDICGDWAGSTSVYNDEDSCPDTCEQYAMTNASAFDTAYWEWNSWRIYQAA